MDAPSRRRRIPGTQQHFAAIKEINQKLTQLMVTFEDHRKKITEIVCSQKNNPRQAELSCSLEEINARRREYSAEFKKLCNTRSELIKALGGIRGELQAEKKKINAGSVAEIDQRLAQLNMSIIADKLGKSKTAEIASEMATLKKKRNELTILQKKDQVVFDMNAKVDEISEEINRLKKEMDDARKKAEEIKAELDLLIEKGRVKNPVVEKIEKKLNVLKAERQKLIEEKKACQEKIRISEIEDDRRREEAAKQQALENRKTEILNRIKQLEADRLACIDEREALDPSKYDIIIRAIQNVKATSGSIKLPIDLAVSLTKSKVPIPSSKEEVTEAIVLLKKKKDEFAGEAVIKSKKIEERLQELSAAIAKEKKVLESMPPTDVRLPDLETKMKI